MLDLAAGTGKLTRVLVSEFARVLAVEPLDELRAVLEERVPGADALPGEAEAIPLPDASVDATFVAEAFHWFGGPVAVAELARVLRPGGTLVLLWTQRRGGTVPPLPAAYKERVHRLREERAAWPYGDERWRPHVESAPFGEIEQATFPLDHTLDRDGMLAYAASWSWIASLPEDERARELRELGDLLDDGEWTLRLRVDVYWTRRR